LIAEVPRDRILISESGLQSADSLLRLRKVGFRGFLVGEALMRASDPETALRNLFAAAEDRQFTEGSMELANDDSSTNPRFVVSRMLKTPKRAPNSGRA